MKETYFVNKIFYRFFIPSILSSFGLALGGIADAFVVGTSMGEAGLAAISFASPIYMVFNTFDVGFALGGSIHYSKLLGKGDARQGLEVFNQVAIFSLLLSVIIAVLGNLFLPQLLLVLGTSPAQEEVYQLTHTYAQILISSAPIFFLKYLLYYFVRCDDNQKLASIALVAGNLVDLVLNFVFVIGLQMGVSGAVISTVIGSAIMVLILLPHLFLRWSILRFRFVRPRFSIAWRSFRTGFASSAQYIYQFIVLIVLNNVIYQMGDATGVAVFDIVYNVSYVVSSIFDGTGMTLQPMVSTFFGEKNLAAIRATLKLSLRNGIILGAVLLALIALLAQPVCLFFGLTNADSIALGVVAIRIYCLSALFASFNMIMSSYYQAINQERYSFFINIMRSFVLFLPFCLVLSLWNIYVFWWAYVAAELFTLLLWNVHNMHKKNFFYLKETETNRVFAKTIGNKDQDLSEIVEEVEAFCDTWEADFTQSYYVTLTVEEICSAIVQNAFGHGEDEYIQLTLVANEDNTFTLHLRDSARSFNPFEMHTKKIKEDDEEGMDAIGILVVKKKARDFFYRRYQGFNTLVITV